MSYDLDIIKVKREKIEKLVESLGCSLEEAYKRGFITVKESEYDYDERVVFLEEDDMIWTNCSMFLGLLAAKGFDCDVLKKSSKYILMEMKDFLEDYFTKKMIENIKEISDGEVLIYFNILKQIICFLEDLKEDEDIYIIQSW